MALDGIIARHGNVWDDEATGLEIISNVVDTKSYSNISIHGVIETAASVSFYVSSNGEDFYKCGKISSELPQDGDEFPREFHWYGIIGARYIALKSSASVNATVTISAKR